jgi:pyridoxamine 5'-phosphate oxidase
MAVIDHSADRDGIFAGQDPFQLARDWYATAQASEVNDPDAVALATVDADGLPNVRIVLLRQIEDDAFTFFTNYNSRKGQELLAAGRAAIVFHWKSLRRQIRVRGPVEQAGAAQSDAYYASRGLQNRQGAWASLQSQPLDRRETLMDRVDQVAAAHGNTPPRPPHWGGFRIRPVEIEFWADGPGRLHDRFRWTISDVPGNWAVTRLFP